MAKFVLRPPPRQGFPLRGIYRAIGEWYQREEEIGFGVLYAIDPVAGAPMRITAPLLEDLLADATPGRSYVIPTGLDLVTVHVEPAKSAETGVDLTLPPVRYEGQTAESMRLAESLSAENGERLIPGGDLRPIHHAFYCAVGLNPGIVASILLMQIWDCTRLYEIVIEDGVDGHAVLTYNVLAKDKTLLRALSAADARLLDACEWGRLGTFVRTKNDFCHIGYEYSLLYVDAAQKRRLTSEVPVPIVLPTRKGAPAFQFLCLPDTLSEEAAKFLRHILLSPSYSSSGVEGNDPPRSEAYLYDREQ